ncbi:phospholipase ABHD3 [Cimex lectularius]|uniref:AB hydrolase-1 domain-containing protein n=1 Tax=Cimex lectularius TaxID=79782 RepID=A0A8I6R822_CIMLE|nr:phospholipase ABHD3 [Cimex lectularius]
MDWIVSGISSLLNLSNWYIGSAFCSGYILYYLFEVVKKPRLACSDGNFKNFLENKVPLLQEKFWPTFWCVEARAQTLMASFVRATVIPHINYRREILTLKDGGEICLDWLEPIENCPKNTPTVIILPGLTGASHADYVKGLVLAGKSVGIRCVVFNQRGIGGITLKTPRTYCASNSEDLVEVIDYVRKVCPDAPVAATGISMGGLILGNYLTSVQNSNRELTCAMLISVPWNVRVGCESIEQPVVNLMLNRHLASCLCNIVRNVRHVIEPGPYAIDDVLKSKTIREFDSKFTVKQFGYKDVDDYYTHASLHDKIHKFKVPVLCLSAADDPFQPLDGIPVDEANKNGNVGIVVTSRGGHIGFMEGFWPIYQNQYMFKLFAQFFDSMLVHEGYKIIK